MGTLHEDQYTFLIIFCSVPHRMRNISHKSCRENQNTHFKFNNFSFILIVLFTKQCGNILQSQTCHRWQYDACTLFAGYLRLQTHPQNM